MINKKWFIEKINSFLSNDQTKCAFYVFKTARYIKRKYGLDIYACGLYQVGVPCQDTFPSKHNLL